ncbi:hypothetical protein [Oxynema sp. CENA135]|uniref:hypothetical protein n=1 Tax=Oxynema sp. CENA135 TaxID=984206 RepID=UPI001F1B3651|nr:hypothetical protein [Oxynema sp. CENA135]
MAKSKEALDIRWSGQLPKGAEPSTVTVRLDPSGRWHISILVDDDTIKPLPQSDKSVGVDVGIAHLAITSDGEKAENPPNRPYQGELGGLPETRPEGPLS